MSTKWKPVTYGLMHFSVAVAVTFTLTGSLATALSIGVVEPLVQTFAYAGHEKLWTKLAKLKLRGPAVYCGRWKESAVRAS